MMSLMSNVDAKTEARLLAAVEQANEVAASAVENRRAAVRAAFEAGISGTVIAKAMGVTRARAYQIRDGR